MILSYGKRILAGILAVLLAAGPVLPVTASETIAFDFDGQTKKEGDFYYEVLNDHTAMITGYEGTASSVIVPRTLGDYPVSRIGGKAFRDCNTIQSIQLPAGLVRIEDSALDRDDKPIDGAFRNCTALTSVVIPDSVTHLGAASFQDCSSLSSVAFGKNLTDIGQYAFKGCEELTSVNIPDGVTGIGDSAFRDCKKLKTVQLPDSLKLMGEKIFEKCSGLTAISIPANVEEISFNAFYSCTSLKKLTIQEGVQLIGKAAFKDCDSLTSVKIPGSVKTIKAFAFYDCDKLKTVTLEEGIKEMEGSVFANCWSLKKLRIPASVTELRYGITHAGVKLEVYEGTAGLKYAKQFYKEYYQPYEVLEKPKALSKAKISSISNQTYTGKNIKPSVTVKYGSKVLKAGTDYTLKYSNNKAVGKAVVTITGKGSYAGTVTKTFTICPKSTTISKVTAKSKGFEIKWKRQSSQTTGYQIQYSTSSKFTAKTTKTLNISKNKTVSKKVTKLKGNQKYYVRIRTYKTVTVSGKSQKIYSGWSKSKTVRTKK